MYCTEKNSHTEDASRTVGGGFWYRISLPYTGVRPLTFCHSLVAYSTVFRLKIVELLCEIVLASGNDILVCLQTGTGRNI